MTQATTFAEQPLPQHPPSAPPVPSTPFEDFMKPPSESSSLPSLWDLIEEDEPTCEPLSPFIFSAPSEASLPDALAPVYELLIDHLEMLTANGDTDTVITLDAPAFKNSPFYGTKITIREFSTAPKVFNVEIATTATALNLLHAHRHTLQHALNAPQHPFSVHLVQCELHTTKRPLFHRKSPVEQGEEESS